MNQHDKKIQYRNISLLVRPARVAILIPQNDEYWKSIVHQIFGWCSSVWGGAYFLIIPTNGKEISISFWKILEEYSPDLVTSYLPTFQDLELAEPKIYAERIAKNKDSFFKQNPDLSENDFENLVLDHLKLSKRYEFEISSELQQEIKQRLTPFYHDEFIIQGHVTAQSFVPFPLTQLDKIANQANLEKVYVVDNIEDIDLSLFFYSNWGLYKPGFENRLVEKGIEIKHIPKDVRLFDLIDYSVRKHVDISELKLRRQFRKSIGQEDNFWIPDEDIVQFTPYETSLIKTGRYRTLESRYSKEPITIIIGNSVEDFCLYYSLSRIQDDVYWIPEIKSPINKTESNPRNDFNSIVIESIIRKDRLDRSNHNFVLTSISLTTDQLEIAQKQISDLKNIGETFNGVISIEPTPWLIEKTTYRIIEQNNYTTTYTEVFNNNKGVGYIPTPKPKNFGQVIPYDHRWITELNINGYRPPQLHFLGKDIINLRGLTTETRVSKTGVCYQCPNLGYFGGDIDVTLVRPKINLVDPFTIFESYYAEAGYNDIRLSDKGSYTQQSIELFGDLDEIGKFLQKKSHLDFLYLYLNEKSINHAINGEVVYTNKRAYVNFTAIEYLLGSEDATVKLIDSFIQKEIIYRGTILQCSYCRQSDWYGIDELDRSFVCHRCNQKQTIQLINWKEGKEPGWYYKLNEIIFQGLKNHMEIPLLTLFRLKKDSKESFLFVSELELRKKPKSARPLLEIDICCIMDGNIIIGECRKGPIDKGLIDKLSTFASTLLKYPNELIFSTQSSNISDEIDAYAKSKIKSSIKFITNVGLENIS